MLDPSGVSRTSFLAGAAAVALLSVGSIGLAAHEAQAATTVDQLPVPLTSTGNSELLIQSNAVSGGTLYTSVVRDAGAQGQIKGVAQNFVPNAAASPTRPLTLTNCKATTGLVMTGTPTGGAFGVNRTAGASLYLQGETTTAGAKTDTVFCEAVLADSYAAGAAIPVVVNANYTGSGTVSAATGSLAAYTESTAGVEAALSVTSSVVTVGASAGNLTYSIAGTGLTPGQRMGLQLALTVTSSSGNNVGQVNSIGWQQ